jgi:DNA-binding ferritin-like protein
MRATNSTIIISNSPTVSPDRDSTGDVVDSGWISRRFDRVFYRIRTGSNATDVTFDAVLHEYMSRFTEQLFRNAKTEFALPKLKWVGVVAGIEMSSQQQPRRELGTVEENGLRLDTEKAGEITEALNTDLAATYVLYHQLRKHHWNVEGAEYRDLHLFLGDAAESAEEAADELAERVQGLGGVPLSGPASFEEESPVKPEGPDVYDIRTSMENDLEMYGDIIETVRGHIELATEFGDHATAEMLRQQLLELEEYAHTIDHFLEDDSLKQ